MFLRVNNASSAPLADQIAEQIRIQIAGGSLKPGEKLPAAKALAKSLDVNMHTVLRGYKQLREEGLIEIRRGSGTKVRSDITPASIKLAEAARDLVQQAQQLGLETAEIHKLIDSAARP